ncbi:MAG: penicillin-binding protein [Deltaproteobacteria bacterium]|nr:penicillin-binding protein [Deltaproteobacteria bacterium]
MDIRFGYTRIPFLIRDLSRLGFFVEAQAEISQRLAHLIDRGIFAIYPEKSQAGLKVLDRNGETLYQAIRPERIYKSFEEIPPIVTKTILFIENREILDPTQPYRNPAVEWDRLGRAIIEKSAQIFFPSHSAPGGSTIATQLEKYLHGYEGRTRGVKDKLQQMLSASYRAYLDGAMNYPARERIVLKYINSIPLAALFGYGEVNGLGDGLWAWYGLELDEVNELLGRFTFESARQRAKEFAPVYKQMLSLFVAHRRPSFYLLNDAVHLDKLTNEYLRLLAAERVIPTELRDAAIAVKLSIRTAAPPAAPVSFIERKAANAIRTRLLKLLKLSHLYSLDQVDLTVKSSLDKKVNEEVSEILASLRDKKNVKKYGLMGDRTLARGDPAKVIYSVTLYERVDSVNLLRVQVDNLDRPFDINEGTRLDLGSTAKLRVLANYLEIIAEIHDRLKSASKKELIEEARSGGDALTRWVAGILINNSTATLREVLDQAMSRTYSASPGESFFTGGGLHTFSNFNKDDNGRTVTVQESLRHSINLSFIRIMRDVLRYYIAQLTGEDSPRTRKSNARRQHYLEKFADREGTQYLAGFYKKYKGRKPQEILAAFIKSIRTTPKRLAVVHRHIFPDRDFADFVDFMQRQMPKTSLTDKSLKGLFQEYSSDKYSLNDKGYIVRVHPLELWLVGYMMHLPEASFAEAQKASYDERLEVYEWLMKKSNRRAQDVRIRSMIEEEAFELMSKVWKRLGFPFRRMVPSLASAIGNSGDRPAALAELMGIIVNDGVKLPMQRMERMHFAKGTPFETILSINRLAEGERVMRPEVAAVLRQALRDVVENGTARRVDKTFKNSEGAVIPVGGKTGTGDNRFEKFGKGGQLISSRVVNRTATFVFYIGQRFFGTVTAHVQGENAANYDFTSALAAEVLKAIAPALEPLVKTQKGIVADDKAQKSSEKRDPPPAKPTPKPTSTPVKLKSVSIAPPVAPKFPD